MLGAYISGTKIFKSLWGSGLSPRSVSLDLIVLLVPGRKRRH